MADDRAIWLAELGELVGFAAAEGPTPTEKLLARALAQLETLEWLEGDYFPLHYCPDCGMVIHEGDRRKPGMHGEDCQLAALLAELRASQAGR